MVQQIMVAIITMLILTTTTSAQIVTVTGTGASEEAAIKDAKRMAVEEVVGTFLKARSMSSNFKLVMDTIETRTQGYVNSCEIISKTKNKYGYEIQARIDVSSEPSSSLMSDVELVMLLHDPKLAVETEYYGDDGGENYKKYPTMTTAAIREELIKHGFSHVVDDKVEADYIIISKMTVKKTQEIKLPSWNNISDENTKMTDTGLSKSTAVLDCKIKKVGTDEVIGEFHVSGGNIDTSSNDVQSPAVIRMAATTAQEVRKIFNREASKAFFD